MGPGPTSRATEVRGARASEFIGFGQTNNFSENMYPFLVKGYIKKERMPALSSNQFFITISPRDDRDVDQIKVLNKSMIYPEHHVVRETGSKGDHIHYHIYVRSAKEKRTDAVKRSWESLYEGKEDIDHKHFCMVKIVDNIQRLIGGYLNKDDSTILATTFAKEDIEKWKTQFEKFVNNRPKVKKMKAMTMLNAPLICQEIRKDEFKCAYDNKLWNLTVLNQVLNQACVNGYNIIPVTRSLNALLKQLKAMDGDQIDWFDQIPSFGQMS